MSAPIGDNMVGRTIAHYEILARVGGGGMGVVYRARDARLGRIVALKFLPPQWSHDEDARQRFVREAQAASATHHPSICTIHDIETADDGQLFIVMAYYEGETLKKRLASGEIPIEDALDIATQIADGLARAHAQGVVHRDIKPGNLILTEDGVRILDFGLATFADALKLTIENSTLGTAAYMSPEQVRGQSVDARSDVWALGVVLYEMLTGHVPFQGSHGEAVAYAIRHETPASLRMRRAGITEDVEHLVFRALHKEPAVRFQNGRDFARALRRVRGHSMPLDLRTEPVMAPVMAAPSYITRPRRRRRSLRALLAAAALVLAAVLAGWWVFRPIDRVPIAIVPVVNQTGYPELDAYRLGLTQAIGLALSDSSTVRVIAHDQVSAILAGIRARGHDVSSGEALQAIKTRTSARVLVAVTMLNLNDGSGFRARVDFRNAETLMSEGAAFETPAAVSVLVKDTAYRLIPAAVDGIEERFRSVGPMRGRIADWIRRVFSARPAPVMPIGNLDAAEAFEKGIGAYESLEYSSALDAFGVAAEHDRLSPLPMAWRSRVALAMRRDAESERFAREAVGRLSNATPARDRLFVEAIAAESRRDAPAAMERYQALRDASPDDPAALMELAAFQDRQGRTADAIATYHEVLARDERLLRPHVELCRLYNRVNESINAREQGQRAVDGYSAVNARGGHAQALFCLTDSLRVGDDEERAEAVRYATSALQMIEELQYPYNLPRAFNYLALAQEAQGRLDDASRLWGQALSAAREAGNAVLEPLVLMNLGVTNEKLGRRASAIEYLRQSSRGFEALGDQARAAENLFNVGATLIAFGGDSDEGLRNVRDALAVFRSLGNRSFEVRAAHVMSTYYRYRGRYPEAERELSRASSLASERDLDFRSATTAIRLAQIQLGTGDYEGARRLLTDALPRASVRSQLEARIYLAQAYVRLGDFASADSELDRVRGDLGESGDAGLLPLLHVVDGERALEQGQTGEARRHFSEAAAFLTDDLPDVDALMANAYLAVFDARDGRYESARARVERSLEGANRLGHVSLDALCRAVLAEIETGRRRFEQALQELSGVPGDDETRRLEREVRLRVLFWHRQAAAGKGDTSQASADRAAATQLIRELTDRLDEPHRATFLARPVIAGALE